MDLIKVLKLMTQLHSVFLVQAQHRNCFYR